ncbi:hypothetical protein B0T17DRAFT_499489 [Bombardia bombarda]|uniref:Uncharacterized protein n=1 Tax=Bombardia bombarda TaxID=252184 RepID=A0AA39WAP8_9PEZI|nr:hypothetical protein B0T17DRAFT_499489 [Bombardia bombarda]
MCEYTQREYDCGHFRWVASKWCKVYSATSRCNQREITSFQKKLQECGECRTRRQPPMPWEDMILGNNNNRRH